MSSTSAEGLTALSSTLLGLSTAAIGLRFYTRHVQKLPLRMDDWITIPCLVSSISRINDFFRKVSSLQDPTNQIIADVQILFIGTTATTFYGVNKKVMGYPTPKDLQEVKETAAMTSKLYIAFDFFSITTLGGIKICALLFFRRIFCVLNGRAIFNALTLVTILVVALWTVAFLIMTGLQCGTHFSALWSGALAETKYCHISYPFLLSLTISDFLLDIWTICLPLHPIWTIKASLKRRLAVMGIFLLALVGLAACIARLVVYVQIEDAGRTAIRDARLVNTKAIYLSVLEAGLSLVAVNLPSLWFLFTKVEPESFLRSVRSMISLRSDRSVRSSQNTGGIHPHPSSLDKKRSHSSSSQSRLAHPDAHSVQTYAAYDIGYEEHGSPMLLGKIQITDRITQSVEQV